MWIDPRIQGRIRELMGAAIEASNASDSSKVTELLEHALVLAQATNNPYLIAEASRRVAKNYFQLGDFTRSIELFTQTIAYAEKEKEYSLLAHSYRLLGSCYFDQSEYGKAESSCLRSIQVCEKYRIQDAYVWALAEIAMIYRTQSRYPEALDYTYRAHREFDNTPSEIFDSSERIELNILILLRLATTLYEIRDIRGALNIYENQLLPLSSLNFPRYTLVAYSNIGSCYIELQEYDKAITYFLKTRLILETYPRLNLAIHLSCELSDCYNKLGEVDKANLEIEKAYQLSLQSTEHFELAYILGLKGAILRARKDPGAIDVLLQAAEIYHTKEENITSDFRNTMREIWEYFKDNGAYEQGVPYLDKYIRLSEELEEQTRKAFIQLETEQYKQQKRVYELELERKQAELSMQATQLVTQTEFLAKFRDEMREIVRKAGTTDAAGALKEVKEKLKELPCKQIDWEKFETEFKAVHPEFMHKLYERYPALTPMEVKMCSLLRLALKSQEIARLFCVTERAVEFHRLNIRKKCGIPKEQSLSAFLNNL